MNARHPKGDLHGGVTSAIPAALAVASATGACIAVLASAEDWAVAALAALAAFAALVALVARPWAPRSDDVGVEPDTRREAQQPPAVQEEPPRTPTPHAPDLADGEHEARAAARSSGHSDPGERLDDEPWIALVQDAVDLVDEVDRLGEGLSADQRELADHVMARLVEILRRADVAVITGDEPFDRMRHSATGAPAATSNASIVETYSLGFAVEQRVLLRARVRVE